MDMTDLMLRMIVLTFVLRVTALQLHSPPRQTVSMPCEYDYEAHGAIEQLSLQWRSPKSQLLCHFIKHKDYRNCTQGYSALYTPGNITLIIHKVKEEDFGKHVCSVSKRHAFLDYIIELVQVTESSTPLPTDKEEHSGYAQDHLLLLGCSLFVSLFGC
ncbi:hypothetical protein PDJAM_G00168760 [Pangasius djambal]|uniref:Uncharacterized protein n=1 Tax=Pangasius djambal TaxID=1691987 RepID=A0ACC5ZLZ2_9TELE|nr:hypothetical protein [Pangasius djambal]